MSERSDYCRSCSGYSADVGNLDDNGWCERCTYRNALEAIAKLCEGSWRHEQVRDLALRALKETRS